MINSLCANFKTAIGNGFVKFPKEVLFIAIAKLFLEKVSSQLTLSHHPLAIQYVRRVIVYSPLLEEIIFRVLVMEGIHQWQKWQRCLRKLEELTEADMKSERVFRIRLTAVLFAAAHLANAKDPMTQLLQCGFNYIQGLHYGWLRETYGTGASIAAHGISNAFPIMVKNQFLTNSQGRLGLMVYSLALYIWRKKM